MMKRLFLYSLLLLLAFSSCGKDGMGGISSIENPRAEKPVARYGETVTVTFQADGPWEAEVVMNEGEGWAEITQVKDNDKAGKGTVRIRFARNEQGTERTADLYVKVVGGERTLVASFTQAAGDDTSADYSKLDIDMEVSYDKFLYTHLTMLGDKNIEDGGYYRDYSSSAGERYIYSYISELTTTKSVVPTKAGELSSVSGLGIGPLFASIFEDGTNYIGLTVGYVYPGSPAETAGLRRGDTIYKVGGTRITKSNYQSYMNELFYTGSGSYSLTYARYEANEAAQKYDLKLDQTVNVTASTYGYNPILFAAVLTNSDIEGDEI